MVNGGGGKARVSFTLFHSNGLETKIADIRRRRERGGGYDDAGSAAKYFLQCNWGLRKQSCMRWDLSVTRPRRRPAPAGEKREAAELRYLDRPSERERAFFSRSIACRQCGETLRGPKAKKFFECGKELRKTKRFHESFSSKLSIDR